LHSRVSEREASELESSRPAMTEKTVTKKLEGKTAVITGGTEGIGLAAAKRFVDEGAYVFITGRRQKQLDEAVKAIGANVAGVQGDIAQLADLDRPYETVARVRRIDIVFANAGGVYAASKAALRSFVRTWTTDLKDRRIRSNVVSPRPINTPLASRQSADVIARMVSGEAPTVDCCPR
jgi:NAD(P)-dependent dehydrogenase (short-subunit alcohol dehydrogenase family)